MDRRTLPRRDSRTSARAVPYPDPVVDIAIIRSTQGDFYTAGGEMPPGVPELLKRYVDATVPAIRDARIDLSATWTNQYLPKAD